VYRRSDGRGRALKRRRIIRFAMERGMKIISLGTGFFIHKRIISAVRRVELVSDRMSYIKLRGH
jgi:hypothetical protein